MPFNCRADAPAYCERSTDLNMRGSRPDESSALHRDGAPIGGGFFGQSSFCTYAIAGSRNAVVLPEPIDPALAPRWVAACRPVRVRCSM